MSHQESKNYLQCTGYAARCLSTCIGYALYNNKKMKGIDINDIESLREALRILRPNIAGLAYFDAMIQIEKGDLATATTTLRDVLYAVPDYTSAKAILTDILFKQKDPSWKSLAHEIIESNDSLESEIEMVHFLFESDWMKQGIWSKEKADNLKKERLDRFQKTETNMQNQNSMNTIQPYAIRM